MKYYNKLKKRANDDASGDAAIAHAEIIIKHFDAVVKLLEKTERYILPEADFAIREIIKHRLARIENDARKALEGK